MCGYITGAIIIIATIIISIFTLLLYAVLEEKVIFKFLKWFFLIGMSFGLTIELVILLLNTTDRCGCL